MATQTLQIEQATVNDVDELVDLINSAYRGESSKKGWTTEADLLGGQRTDPDSMLELLKKEQSVVLKCSDEKGKLIGCVNLQNQGDNIYLGMLTVSPGLQGAGIGKKLLAASENHARVNGFAKIRMTVISVRTELVDWYERHGYLRNGETKPFPAADPRFGIPKRELEFVVMEKQL